MTAAQAAELKAAGCERIFRGLTEAVDTTTQAGRMMMRRVGAFAEFERALLRERAKVGLDAARQERAGISGQGALH